MGFIYDHWGARADAIPPKQEPSTCAPESLRGYRWTGAMRAGFSRSRATLEDVTLKNLISVFLASFADPESMACHVRGSSARRQCRYHPSLPTEL